MKEIWIGQVEVVPGEGNEGILDGAAGAFVHVLALVSSEQEYQLLVSEALSSDGFHVLEISDVEPLQERLRTGGACEEILQLAEDMDEENKLRFDEFQAYMAHDA